MVAIYQCTSVCGGTITNNSGKYEIKGDGLSSGNLTIKDLATTDNGMYTCSVAVKSGIANEQVELFVQTPGK